MECEAMERMMACDVALGFDGGAIPDDIVEEWASMPIFLKNLLRTRLGHVRLCDDAMRVSGLTELMFMVCAVI